MPGRKVNLLTLGVRDLDRSKAFFEALFGWRPIAKPFEGVAFYDMGGWLLSLFPRGELAKDAGVGEAGAGFRGLSLAHNVESREEVAQVMAEALRLGAREVKPSTEAFWGGQTAYFEDIDGHLWEIAWNPGFPKAADGSLEVDKIV